VFGAIGADGRVVEEPTVVPVPLFSAVRGPLHGAHIHKSAKTAIAAISAIIPAPVPSGRIRARCAIAVLVIIKHFVLLYCRRSNKAAPTKKRRRPSTAATRKLAPVSVCSEYGLERLISCSTSPRLAYLPRSLISFREQIRPAFVNRHPCAASHSRSFWRRPRRPPMDFDCCLPSCPVLL